MKKVLLIFTGGTISMGETPDCQGLAPLNSEQVFSFIPELKMLNVNISSISFSPLIDSSDINPEHWKIIAKTVFENYDAFDGFVVLHGTDTMAYSASALSYMIKGLTKPVIFTGSQLPVGVLRSDAKENLITAIELAAAKNDDGSSIVPEVCLFFEGKLMRGNRTTKRNSEDFNAFQSFNYPKLARTGVHIKYYPHVIAKHSDKACDFKYHSHFDTNVVILKIFPGITEQTVRAIYNIEGLKGVVLESFGAGNGPTADWFYNIFKEANDRGIVTVNVSQCRAGSVEMGLYEASVNLMKAGVISGKDITLEAAVTKLMWLLGKHQKAEDVRHDMTISFRGEMTV